MSQPTLDELISLGERLSAPIGDPTNWDEVTLSWFRSAAGASDAKFIRAACNAIIPLARAHQSAMEALVVSASVLESLWASEYDGTALCQAMKDGILEALELARPVIYEAATELAGMGKGKETT